MIAILAVEPRIGSACYVKIMRLSGKWRIVEMALWDREAIELLGPASIEFDGEGGQFRFIPVDGTMSYTSIQRRAPLV